MEALVGSANPYVRDGAQIPAEAAYGPGWSQRTSTAGPTSGPDNTYQHIARTTLYDKDEFAQKEMKEETYNYQSMMSLDGIISPISFYPTPYGSLFLLPNMTERTVLLQGKGIFNNVLEAQRQQSAFPSIDEIPVSSKSSVCTFCVTPAEKAKEREQGADLSVTIRQPPYIVDFGPDSEVSNEGDECNDSKNTY